MPIRRRNARGAGLLLLALVVLAAAWAASSYYGPGPKDEPTSIFITPGSGLSAIASGLDEAGVIRSRLLFTVIGKLSGEARNLRAGEYQFAPHASMHTVLKAIREGRVVRHQVVVPEGFTSEMVVERLRAEPSLTGTVEVPPEGSLLPATYDFRRGESRAAVLQRMQDAQDKLMAQLWPGRAKDLPFTTQQEAIALASIVEKETAVAAERPRIAAVFVNRLRKGMRLESDPTIIYGVTRGKPLGRPILASEVKAATPWNTYVILGLPQTPIANPGREAIAAVLNPPKSEELFFVADGTGGHVFSETFEQHQKNVAKWRVIKAQQMKAGIR
ncbi:MAG TPA: endolytic transglycosylase MltG [Caulobacteraceae bacterium]